MGCHVKFKLDPASGQDLNPESYFYYVLFADPSPCGYGVSTEWGEGLGELAARGRAGGVLVALLWQLFWKLSVHQLPVWRPNWNCWLGSVSWIMIVAIK